MANLDEHETQCLEFINQQTIDEILEEELRAPPQQQHVMDTANIVITTSSSFEEAKAANRRYKQERADN
jgi:hypothetical protein